MQLDRGLPGFFSRLGRALQVPMVQSLLGTLFTLIAFATLFYHWVEGWRYVDAFYFSVVTLATVGYGDFAPKTDAGKLFTVFLIMSGIGIFVTTATAIANGMLAGVRENADTLHEQKQPEFQRRVSSKEDRPGD